MDWRNLIVWLCCLHRLQHGSGNGRNIIWTSRVYLVKNGDIEFGRVCIMHCLFLTRNAFQDLWHLHVLEQYAPKHPDLLGVHETLCTKESLVEIQHFQFPSLRRQAISSHKHYLNPTTSLEVEFLSHHLLRHRP